MKENSVAALRQKHLRYPFQLANVALYAMKTLAGLHFTIAYCLLPIGNW